jgi:hypothetical protein
MYVDFTYQGIRMDIDKSRGYLGPIYLHTNQYCCHFAGLKSLSVRATELVGL